MDIQTHDRTARQCRNRQTAGRSGAADGDLGKESRAEQSAGSNQQRIRCLINRVSMSREGCCHGRIVFLKFFFYCWISRVSDLSLD